MRELYLTRLGDGSTLVGKPSSEERQMHLRRNRVSITVLAALFAAPSFALTLTLRETIPHPGSFIYAAAIGPLDGVTGNALAVVTQGASSRLIVYEHDGTAYQAIWATSDAGNLNGLAVAIGDADSDAANELLASFARYTGGRAALFEWDGTTFSEIRSVAIANDDRHIVTIGDTDRDGMNEIVIGESYVAVVLESRLGRRIRHDHL